VQAEKHWSIGAPKALGARSHFKWMICCEAAGKLGRLSAYPDCPVHRTEILESRTPGMHASRPSQLASFLGLADAQD
jgi:hypothetical protein